MWMIFKSFLILVGIIIFFICGILFGRDAKENGFDQKTSTMCLLISWVISAIFILLGVKL